MKNILIVLLIVFVSCKSPSDKKTETKSIELEQLQTSIDSLFNSNIAENEPGAAILVSYDGQMIIGKGYGMRDLEGKEPITKSTNMRMGSVSKQFTVLCVLDLIDKGKLKLQDTVYNIYPYKIFKNVTIEQFINHTSGIADAEDILLETWDPKKIAENEDIVELYSKNPSKVSEPGVIYKYNNGAYELLASIVKKISAQEFEQYAKENIFQKARMKNTDFFNLAKPVTIIERANCYGKDSLKNWVKVDGHPLNGLLGADGVYTSVIDFFEYDLDLRNKSIVSQNQHDVIFKPSSMAFPEQEKYKFDFLKNGKEFYAMGWFVRNDIALHTGSWMGTNTIVVHELNRPLTIAIFMNFANPSTRSKLIEKTYKLVDIYLKTTANN